MKYYILILSCLVIFSGCRTVENVTESESSKVKTENIKTDTEVVTEKITTFEIPIEYFKYFPQPDNDSTSNTTQVVTKKDTSNSKTVTVTTKENTVTRQTQDKNLQEKTDTETKQETTKTPLFNWNYIWILISVIVGLFILKIYIKY